MNKYELFKMCAEEIRKLCITADIPVPIITTALPTDPCDVTGYSYIRLNLDAFAKDVESMADGDPEPNWEYYVNHVFAHYLCGVHEIDEHSDNVADFIADMLSREYESENLPT